MIEFETYIEDKFNDKNVNVKEFFTQIIINFANESLAFYDMWNEFPFIYSEKQVNSVLIPAIYKYTETIFLEQPFKKDKNKQRFLDILTKKDNNVYLIELKHSYQSKEEETTIATDDKWKKAIEQIKDLNKSVIEDIFETEPYTFYKVALLISPTFVPKKSEHKILKDTAKKYSEKIFNEYLNGYKEEKYQPNIVGVIKFNHSENYIQNEKKYPFVSFIIKIEEITQ